MRKGLAQKRDVDFLLENKHFKRLHLTIYICSLVIIFMIYFATILLFSRFINIALTASISVVLGLTLVFYRDKLAKRISEYINSKKRRQYKEKNKKGLKSTLKNVSPKKKVTFSIKNNLTFKEKIELFKDKFSKKKPKRDYIEIK